MEEREKFLPTTSWIAASRTLTTVLTIRAARRSTVSDQTTTVKRPDSGGRSYGSDAACVDWLYNEDYNAGVVITYVDSTASEVVQDLSWR
jgi:hypothetical protein